MSMHGNEQSSSLGEVLEELEGLAIEVAIEVARVIAAALELLEVVAVAAAAIERAVVAVVAGGEGPDFV